ncbi:excalibur calcium-binding domain-containing protein [Novosphingobium sp. KN65.2]|uniref:excalibur calcium-binding domain-containing protein n=1 Tax=Novosphingobium sp. KN65.2 TaxID=1478134 RepID=UPI0009E8620F|nr:excalibur calcium-binding domain-containing protein [Novosphingobium sp. KN65.2]
MGWLNIFFALLALPVTCGCAFAHPGGLNAEGCHNNRKTGDYHCHRSTGSSQQQNPPNKPQSLFGQQRQSGAYRNCTEARAAGAAPVYIGQPGYGPHLDRDGDGIGCEPYRGR